MLHNASQGPTASDGKPLQTKALTVQFEEWRRGDSNPKRSITEPLQLCDKTTTEPNIQPSEGLLAKQYDTLPIQNNNTSKHQTGANMVHEITNNQSDPMLCKIVEAWPELPDHIKLTIKTLVSSGTGLNNQDENK